MSYVVLDIETTGLDRRRDHITEIAAARVIDGNIVREFHTMVNPRVRIPEQITKLTGIDNAMVKDAPYLHEVIPAMMKFFRESTLVAHNASFDLGFLEHNSMKYFERRIENPSLCTKMLGRRVLPQLGRYRLQDLCQHYGVVNVQAHRAMADVHATVGVLLKMQEKLRERQILTPEALRAFSRTGKVITIQ